MKIKKKRAKKKTNFYDPVRDGVTQGILGKFLDCRVKCKTFAEGYSSKGIRLPLTYGSISHGCLELAYGDMMKKRLTKPPSTKQVMSYVSKVGNLWRKENPRADKFGLEILESSLLFAEAVLPEYFKYWAKDFTDFKWHALEGEFRIIYVIKNGPFRGTIIPIRGKKDGQFEYKKQKGLWLFETKNKSRIDEGTLLRLLPFELQIQLYLWAVRMEIKSIPKGTLYNVLRRPGLRQGAKESLSKFAIRCAEDVRVRPEWYFMRYEIAISKADINMWVEEFDGLISDFYRWCIGDLPTYKNTGHCENKYGKCEYLCVCAEGDYPFLEKRKVVFRELEDL